MGILAVDIRQLTTMLGGAVIHRDLDLTVQQGEIIAIIGASGCGKTTLIRTILMLLRPASGSIHVFEKDVLHSKEAQANVIRRCWGVMFQSGALFSSMTVLENIMFPMMELVKLPQPLMYQLALFKLNLVGLSKEAAWKYPSELSGGMCKRVALARALALDPQLVFLDEPTAGLDPQSADAFDDLVLQLHRLLGITLVMITHDLDTLWRVPHRVIFLGEGKVLAACPMSELVKHSHPLIQRYFSGPRGQQQRLTQEGVTHGY